MKRLTSKTNSKPYSYKYLDIDDCMEGTPIEKLGQLEDIEELFGFELLPLLKAMTAKKYDDRGKTVFYGRVFGKNDNDDRYPEGIYEYDVFVITFLYAPFQCVIECQLAEAINGYFWHKNFSAKDYGKTWALTREELE